MKNLITLGFMSLTLFCHAQTWTILDSGTDNTLYTINFIDDQIGYAVGAAGTIIKTTNGGDDWTVQNSGVNSLLYACDFIDASNGVIAGDDGMVLKTNNGGGSWTEVASGTTVNLRCVHFANDDIGFISGLNGTLLRTTNGGSSWSPVDAETSNDISHVHFTNSSVGYFSGEAGMMKKSNDGGLNWSTLDTGTSDYLATVHFSTEDFGFTTPVFGGGSVYSTENGGTTWYETSIDTEQPLFEFSFFNSQMGFAAGGNFNAGTGVIIFTEDGGQTWDINFETDVDRFISITYVSLNIAYAVGQNGLFAKFVGDFTAIEDSKTNEGTQFVESILLFPNPTHSSAFVQFDNLATDIRQLQITITDDLGRVSKQLQCPITMNKANVDLNGLNAGQYTLSYLHEDILIGTSRLIIE